MDKKFQPKNNSSNFLTINFDFKKCVTTTNLGNDPMVDGFKRIKTVQPGKFFNQEKLQALTENPYTITRVSTEKVGDFSNVFDDNDKNIILDNGGLKVTGKTIKKMSAVLKDLYDSKTEDKSNSPITNIHKLTIKKVEELAEKKEDKEMPIVSQEIEKNIPEENLQLLDSLMYQYYQEISANYVENYDNYVVNNLIIISYLEKILPKDVKPPKLNNEQIDAIRSFDRTKKTLFLDLDETLIHSDTMGQFDKHDALIKLILDENEIEFGLLIRPFCKEFLEFASKNFNVILFTAGHKIYAEAIINHLDPKKEYFHLRLYRDSCIEFKNFFIKDLSILPTFGLKDLIIVDNCLFSFSRSLTNGILISTYYNEENDSELSNLMGYLENNVVDCKDIRSINENVFKFESTKSFLYDQLKSEGVLK